MNTDLARNCVCTIYRVLLGREPDASGLEFYTKTIQQTGDITSVLSGILNSQELMVKQRRGGVEIRHPFARRVDYIDAIYKHRAGSTISSSELLSVLGTSSDVSDYFEVLCRRLKMGNRRSPRFLLFGAYGNGNLGDAYQALALREHLMVHWGVASASIFACSWLDIAGYPFPSDQKVAPNKILDHSFLSSFDGLLIGGGGLFAHPHEPLVDENWASQLKVPVLLVAVGATKSLISKANQLISDAFFVTGRDSESVAALSSSSFKTTLMVDPILAIPNIEALTVYDAPSTTSGQSCDVLWILKYPANNTDRNLINEAKRLAKNKIGGRHLFVAIEPRLDRDLIRFFSVDQLIFVVTAIDLFGLIRSAKVVLSMRYHGVIFSLLANKLVYGMSQRKSSALFTECAFNGGYIENFEDLLQVIQGSLSKKIDHSDDRRRVSRMFKRTISSYKVLNAYSLADEKNSEVEKRVVFENGSTVAKLMSIGSDKLAITFQSYDFLGFEKKGLEEDFLISLGYDVLCFKPSANIWYQDISLNDIVKLSDQFLNKYRYRIGYGSSMGAYAALYFAASLDLHKVIAVSPQFSIDRKLASFDPRWANSASTVLLSHGPMKGDCAVELIAIYDSFNRFDKTHVQLIRKRFPVGQDITLPFSGHPSAWALRDSGYLNQTIEQLLHEQKVDTYKVRRSIRLNSNDYASSLLLNCLRRGARRTVLAFDALVKVRVSDLVWLRKRGLELLGELRERGNIKEAYALASSIEHICELDTDGLRVVRDFFSSLQRSTHAARVALLICEVLPFSLPDVLEASHALARVERLDESLKLIERAIALDSGAAEFHRLHASVLERMGRFRESGKAIAIAVELSPERDQLHIDQQRIFTQFIEQLKYERDTSCDFSHAIVIAEEIVSRLPNNTNEMLALTHLLARSERLHESLVWIDRAIALDSGAAEFHRLRASVLERMGRFKSALKAAATAFKLSKSQTEVLVDIRRIRKKVFLKTFGLYYLIYRSYK